MTSNGKVQAPPILLRPYQARAVEELRAAVREGARRVVLVAPVAAGKTTVAAEVMRGVVAKGRRGLFLAHREELINQAADRLASFGLPAGVIMADDKRVASERPVQVASVMTLVRRLHALPQADVVILDEAHRGTSAVNKKILDSYPNAVLIGLSVAADSRVELRGGPFGTGWAGPIDMAFAILRPANVTMSKLVRGVPVESIDTTGLGVEARGWTDAGFAWKPVASFLRHPYSGELVEISTTGATVSVTPTHSVYQPGAGPPECRRADTMRRHDTLIRDDGRLWGGGDARGWTVSVPDVIGGDTALATKVAVDISGITRKSVGVTPSAWYMFKRGRHGSYLPLDLYLANRRRLPAPTIMYTEGARGASIDANIDLRAWAFFLGFFLGNGWVDGKRVGLSVKNSDADRILRRVQALPGVRWKPRPSQRQGSVQISCPNTLVAGVLSHLLGRVSAPTKRIPSAWIISWPEAARRALLDGLVSSDGHRRNNETRYTTTSPGLATDITLLLRSLGIRASIYATNPQPGGSIAGRRIVGQHPRYDVAWTANVPLTTKAPVRSVGRTSYCGWVYDMAMAGHPSFVANGLLVHNTATPFRLDGQGLGSIFDKLIEVTTPEELISLGFLTRPRVWGAPAEADLSGVATARGDFAPGGLGTVMSSPELVGNVVEHWQRLAAGRRTIVFAANVAHSKVLAARFAAAGVPSAHLDASTPGPERRTTLARLAAGEVLVLCSVGLFTEGWDLPSLECAVIARPTMSRGMHRQMIGRIMRVDPLNPGKTGIVLDHAGNHARHGFAWDPETFDLAGVEKRTREAKAVGLVNCKTCLCIFPSDAEACPECGAIPVRKKQRPVRERTGTLEELKEAKAAYGRRAPSAERIRQLARLVATARVRGWKPGAAHVRYKAIFGTWPTAHDLELARRVPFPNFLVFCGVCRGCGGASLRVQGDTFGCDDCSWDGGQLEAMWSMTTQL